MKVFVLNRERAKEYSFKPHDYRTAMISITDIDRGVNNIAISSDNVFAVLKLKFDDVESGVNCITEKDGRKIADFVNGCKDRTDCFVVHCEAGISRSAGVAAAIMKFFNNDDMPIFDNPLYCPNMACYRTVLNALSGVVDETLY